jgi:hypothetical protein
MIAKLQPLFDSPAQFKLFRSALEREAQLVREAQEILRGSSTAKTLQIQQTLDEDSGVGEAVASGLTGGFKGSLLSMVSRFVRASKINDETADRLADMLMSSDPGEVATVVRMLEQRTADLAPKALRAGAAEAGATTGITTSLWPQPESGAPAPSVEEEEDVDATIRRLAPSAPGLKELEEEPQQPQR